VQQYHCLQLRAGLSCFGKCRLILKKSSEHSTDLRDAFQSSKLGIAKPPIQIFGVYSLRIAGVQPASAESSIFSWLDCSARVLNCRVFSVRLCTDGAGLQIFSQFVCAQMHAACKVRVVCEETQLTILRNI